MRSILLVTLALLSLAVSAQQIYKWTDDKGVVHYSENPPPNVKATKSNIKSDRPPATAANAAQAAQKTEEDKARAQRAAACRAGLAQITVLQSQPQHYLTNSKGERIYSSDGSVERKTVEAQKTMRKNCD